MKSKTILLTFICIDIIAILFMFFGSSFGIDWILADMIGSRILGISTFVGIIWYLLLRSKEKKNDI